MHENLRRRARYKLSLPTPFSLSYSIYTYSNQNTMITRALFPGNLPTENTDDEKYRNLYFSKH